MVSAIQTTGIVTAVLAVFLAATYAAYQAGYLDPVIERLGVYFFKVKAEAEKKKLQAQGLKAGEDFVEGMFFIRACFPELMLCDLRLICAGELPGNKQADQVKDGIGGLGGQVGEGISGGLGGLKKGL